MIQATPQATLFYVPKNLYRHLHRLIELEAQAKALDAERQRLKEILIAHADERLVEEIRSESTLPPLPIRLVAADGSNLAYVCSSGSKPLTEEQVDQVLKHAPPACLEDRHVLAVNLPDCEQPGQLCKLLLGLFQEALQAGWPRLRRLVASRDRDGILRHVTNHKLKKDVLELVLQARGPKRFAKIFQALEPGLTKYLKAG